MKRLHLICNAHIDPLWQWEFNEGAGAVLSTFRSAVEFCEEYEGFVFNHNEAMIYEWVETYEPELFARIQKLAAKGKWHIMGGWYLQPDCNMPCGESLVRQIETGKRYFLEKFSADPHVAVNVDSFGHTRGLVQILEKAGYTGYLCCRPYLSEMPVPARACRWKGFNGSEVLLHRSDSYNSPMGEADKKVENYIRRNASDLETGLVLWGVGNHGGGPSREDLGNLAALMEEHSEIEIFHSTPEQYFADLQSQKENLEIWEKDFNPTMLGCYTSQVRIKQAHRRLENELYLTEKMCVHAELINNMPYPDERLKEAQQKLMLAEFHDVLPGSSIQRVEEQGLEILHHGLDILREIRTQAFFALCKSQKKAEIGTYPVFVYNPHPYAVQGVCEAEFMLADQNYATDAFDFTQVYQGERKLPSQCVKERSNVPIQWRKRTAFLAELAPFSINRFDIRVEKREFPKLPAVSGKEIRLENADRSLVISMETGLITSYRVHNTEYAAEGFGTLGVFGDTADSWGMRDNLYSSKPVGVFTLVRDPKRVAQIASVDEAELAPVRIIEDGEVLTRVEAIFAYEDSAAIVQYTVNHADTSIEMKVRIISHLKNKMVKLMLPAGFPVETVSAKTAFGINELSMDGTESVSQEYLLLHNSAQALSVVKNGCYGSHFKENALGLTLLRGAAYCAHPIHERKIIPQDRFVERMEQGERQFTFVINASETEERFRNIARESAVLSQPPEILSFFPDGDGKEQKALLRIDNSYVEISALKKREDQDGYILRLFNSSEREQVCTIHSEMFGTEHRETLSGFEICTLHLKNGSCSRTDLLDLSGVNTNR